jgi:hypothetical protein
MSDEELRIRVAELCGWKNVREVIHWLDDNTPMQCCLDGSKDCLDGEIPDYPHDLNAMHEAEKHLRNGKQMNRVVSELDIYGSVVKWNSTARQRAEALVLVMEK